jgi:hypothetical protein
MWLYPNEATPQAITDHIYTQQPNLYQQQKFESLNVNKSIIIPNVVRIGYKIKWIKQMSNW